MTVIEELAYTDQGSFDRQTLRSQDLAGDRRQVAHGQLAQIDALLAYRDGLDEHGDLADAGGQLVGSLGDAREQEAPSPSLSPERLFSRKRSRSAVIIIVVLVRTVTDGLLERETRAGHRLPGPVEKPAPDGDAAEEDELHAARSRRHLFHVSIEASGEARPDVLEDGLQALEPERAIPAGPRPGGRDERGPFDELAEGHHDLPHPARGGVLRAPARDQRPFHGLPVLIEDQARDDAAGRQLDVATGVGPGDTTARVSGPGKCSGWETSTRCSPSASPRKA